MKSFITVDRCSRISFVCSSSCPKGAVRVADMVRKDIFRVIGAEPDEVSSHLSENADLTVLFGLSDDAIVNEYLTDLTAVTGRREVFKFSVLPERGMIVIAGSDKRGLIYGLFRISELLGVSPLVNWSDIIPAKKESLTLSEKESFVSKEPSVRYRGFFINDEWPAFGSWAVKHFGGINAKMYEGVFELLLRLKGNYLWPAMWSSCFACDGPGLESAELADELGVVMGLSHHEPCLRHGEEFSKLRGKDSPYGDAWSFLTNREGITDFWRDGLKRGGHLENVITVGMRGERDSTILGEDATLKDNIDLLRDVLKTQNRLIREEVSPELEKIPRMLALYKEVEPYYYGDEHTEGLRSDPELEGVILMLCDDNHGYVRSLPDDQMRSHNGGFGMYYHFDYHGGPVSYEWINSTYLPEVWEQMSTCFEHGVKDLWIVNVGDLGLQEMPLSYFLDLAYDFDKWGTSSPDSAYRYMLEWCRTQFGSALSNKDISRLADMYMQAARIIHNRRPEHLDESVYSLENGEAEQLLCETVPGIVRTCVETEQKLPEELRSGFFETVGYNVLAGMNLIELWLNRAYNKYFASIGALCANDYAEGIKACMTRDRELRERLHTESNGKWDGLALAEHIGFRAWNSEECRNPVIETVIPVNRGEIIVGGCYEKGATCGGDWTGRRLSASHLKTVNGIRQTKLFAALAGDVSSEYSVRCDKPWLIPDRTSGKLTCENNIEYITLTVDESKLSAEDTAEVIISSKGGKVPVSVTAKKAGSGIPREQGGVICFKAERFDKNVPAGELELKIIKDLGRNESALRLFPMNAEPESIASAPYAEYRFEAEDDGDFELTFTIMPCNPYTFGKGIRIAYSLNGADKQLSVLSEDYEAGVSEEWARGVLTHSRYVTDKVRLSKGINTLRIYGLCRETVFERVTLARVGTAHPETYLGLDETI